jgi:hypothetical protein
MWLVMTWHVVKLPEVIVVFSDDNPAIAKADCDSRNQGDDLYLFASDETLADLQS